MRARPRRRAERANRELRYELEFRIPAAQSEPVRGRASRTYLLSHLAEVRDALTRGAAPVTLWEEMLGGRIPPPSTAGHDRCRAAAERDELNVQRMLSYLQEGFWKFIPTAARTGRADGLERTLRPGLAAARTSSLKSAWFNALAIRR